MEEVSDPNSLCRLCLDDLTQFQEYYEIDENLSETVLTLTTIAVDENDNLSICMCPNCFVLINNFNEAKKSWINNQQILQNTEIYTEEEIIEENLKDEGKIDYRVEFVDDQDPNIEYMHEESLHQHDYSSNRTRKYKKREVLVGESSNKAKEVYKNLLKECSQCGKMIEKNRMEGHMNKHLGKRPFICETENCGKAFYCRLLRRLHVTSIHTGQSVVCQICDKSFPSERALYTHSLRHKNANRYKCDHCEKSFNNSNSLKRHLAIHSGIREWKCDFCPSSFYRKFNLDVHIRTVHQKEKSYSCEFCPKKFGYSRLLRAHMKKFHEHEEVEIEEIKEEVTEC